MYSFLYPTINPFFSMHVRVAASLHFTSKHIVFISLARVIVFYSVLFWCLKIYIPLNTWFISEHFQRFGMDIPVNTNQYQKWKLSSPQRVLPHACQSSPTPTVRKIPSDFSDHVCVLPLPGICINGNSHYVFVCVWLLPLSVIILRFSLVAAHI